MDEELGSKRNELIGWIAEIIINEQFSLGHIEAIVRIVGLMNYCDESENEIIQFSNKLYERYGT